MLTNFDLTNVQSLGENASVGPLTQNSKNAADSGHGAGNGVTWVWWLSFRCGYVGCDGLCRSIYAHLAFAISRAFRVAFRRIRRNHTNCPHGTLSFLVASPFEAPAALDPALISG